MVSAPVSPSTHTGQPQPPLGKCPDVRRLLEKGRRVSLSSGQPRGRKLPENFLVRLVVRPALLGAPSARAARLAISVPKRLEKLAVRRNRIKRWVREALRSHPIRDREVDLLVSLTAKVGKPDALQSRKMREEIVVLFDRALSIAQPGTASGQG